MEGIRRYGTAVLLVIAAAAVTRLLQLYDVPHSSPPYLLAVMFAALYGGRGPGLLATALATIGAAYFDFAPAYSLRLGLDDAVRLAAFTVAALVMSSVSASRMQAEQKLRDALRELSMLDRAKDEFLATVSHELRTPLTSIHGWLQILRHRGTDEETRELALESMHQSTNTLRMLVDDLLDVSRIVVGKLHIDPEPVDVRTVIRAAVDVVRPAAEQQRIGLEIALPDAPAVVLGDADRLRQVIWNLLTNALKFTPAGGSIRVEAVASAPEIVIRVCDTGRGIEEALRPVIFDRFRQGSKAGKGGLGLGLSISKEIVSLHGGTIAAANRPGGGAVFTVALPRGRHAVPTLEHGARA
jgi:signal transduction histidine kinase